MKILYTLLSVIFVGGCRSLECNNYRVGRTKYYQTFDMKSHISSMYFGVVHNSYSNIHIQDKLINRLNAEQPAGEIDTPHSVLAWSASKYYIHLLSFRSGSDEFKYSDYPGPFVDMLGDEKLCMIALDYLVSRRSLFDKRIFIAVINLHDTTDDEDTNILCKEYIIQVLFMQPHIDDAMKLARVVFNNKCQILRQMVDDPMFETYEMLRAELTLNGDGYKECAKVLQSLRNKHIGNKLDGVDSTYPFIIRKARGQP